jgi:Ca2+-binding EF-hand superfamily protein
MPIVEWTLIVGAVVLLGVSLFRVLNRTRQEQQLREAFYQLVETENGYVSLMQLALSARVDAELAKDYLSTQAKVFAVVPEVDPDGDTYYQFPRVKRSLPPGRREEWE